MTNTAMSEGVKSEAVISRDQRRGGANIYGLGLTAAPISLLMALSAARSGGLPNVCSATHSLWPLSDMTTMYLVMAGLHLTPWLQLLRPRSERAGES